MIVSKSNTAPYSTINKYINVNGYRGPLDHLKCRQDFNLFTLQLVPEFITAAAAIVGLGAMIIMHCIIHRSSIQQKTDYEWEQAKMPIEDQPEYVVLSNVLVGRYGMTRFYKYPTVRLLVELGFIELHPKETYDRANIARIGKGILKYKNITSNKKLQRQLRYQAASIRKKWAHE